jgi:DNA-binding response OmpR family regulator/HPt (histidine-containing phosphotransfer) domain-containing protein
MAEEQFDDDFILIQKEFLEEQGETLDRMEQLLLAIEKVDNPKECLRDLKRIVHSLKGAAGSYDLDFATSACHFFEDHIDELESKDTADLTRFFKIVDLLQQFRNEHLEGKVNLRALNASLDGLRGVPETFEGHSSGEPKVLKRALIVESGRTLVKGYKLLLSSFDYDISFSNNGLDAFSRLTQESFDLLITNVTTGHLSGTQLISAVKVTGGASKGLKCILSTSRLSMVEQTDFPPDYILEKDNTLLENLNSILQRLNAGKGVIVKAEDTEGDIINGPKKILCVDDDEAIQKLLELSFKSIDGVSVEQAISFDEAFSKIKSFKPDIILLDYYINGRVGTDFITVLKINGEEAPPIIFLTGRSKEEEVAELMEKDVIGVITKPFRPKKLYKKMTEMFLAKPKSSAA